MSSVKVRFLWLVVTTLLAGDSNIWSSGAATNNGALSSKIHLLRKPDPGAIRALPSGFTKPSPVSVGELRAMEKHVKALLPKVSPAIVSVEIGSSAGSGVIISSSGLVLTAGHVCGRPNRPVTLTFADGKVAKGKTLGLDEDTDCGMIQITDPGPWPFMPVAGAAQPDVGTWVLAMGHPGGYDKERSYVARLGRVVRVSQKAIQTDCTITTGDSGGPLVDMHGRVLAIHSYISNAMAENYHVPMGRFYDHWDILAGGERQAARDADTGFAIAEGRP